MMIEAFAVLLKEKKKQAVPEIILVVQQNPELIQKAAAENNLDMVEFLINACAEIVDKYYVGKGLIDASANGHDEMVALLLSKGDEYFEFHHKANALNNAITKKQPKIITLFIEKCHFELEYKKILIHDILKIRPIDDAMQKVVIDIMNQLPLIEMVIVLQRIPVPLLPVQLLNWMGEEVLNITSHYLRDPAVSLDEKIIFFSELSQIHSMLLNPPKIERPVDSQEKFENYQIIFKFAMDNANLIFEKTATKNFFGLGQYFSAVGEEIFHANNNFIKSINYEKIFEENTIKIIGPKAAMQLIQVALKIPEIEWDKAEQARFANKMLSLSYQINSAIFYNMIFLESVNDQVEKSPYPYVLIVSNNDGYFPHVELFNHFPGNALKLDNSEQTPIGYSIHLPPGKVKSVLVEVYGGSNQQSLEIHVNKPGCLNELDQKLLEQNIAIVKLNLCDYLKNEIFSQLSEKNHTLLHESIHKFFETLYHNPQILHSGLKNLRGANIFLQGSSFGGRTTVRHAELYPHTFKGYISHEGWIDLAKSFQTDLPIIMQREFNKWLNPADPDFLKNIAAPVLVTHNLNDNNVNVKVACSFVTKAQKIGKGHFVDLHLTKNGKPIFSKECKHDKGHSLPYNKKAFDKFFDKVLSFIKNGSCDTPECSRAKHFTYKKRANKFYLEATPLKRFIAEGMLLFKKNRHTLAQLEDDIIWDGDYQTVLDASYFVGKLINDQHRFHSEIERLKNKNLLTDQVLQKVAQNIIPLFLDFHGEYYQEKNYSLNVTDLSQNKHLLNAIRENIFCLNLQSRMQRGMTLNLLTILFQKNPHILPNLLMHDSDYALVTHEFKKTFKETMLKANQLKLKAREEKTIRGHIKAITEQAESISASIKKMVDEMMHPPSAFPAFPPPLFPHFSPPCPFRSQLTTEVLASKIEPKKLRKN